MSNNSGSLPLSRLRRSSKNSLQEVVLRHKVNTTTSLSSMPFILQTSYVWSRVAADTLFFLRIKWRCQHVTNKEQQNLHPPLSENWESPKPLETHPSPCCLRARVQPTTRPVDLIPAMLRPRPQTSGAVERGVVPCLRVRTAPGAPHEITTQDARLPSPHCWFLWPPTPPP